MARYRLRVGVTAAVVALMMAGCAQDDIAPEVDPADAAATSDDSGGGNGGNGGNGSNGNGNGNGSNGNGGNGNGNGNGGNGNGGNGNGNGNGNGGNGSNGNGGNGGNGNGGSSDPNGPGPDDPVDKPALSLAGLPIGGRTYLSIDGNHPDNQCANVNWIVAADANAADLAPGIAVAVTSIEFDPQVFTVASAGCDNDAPPCPGFVFTVDARVCNLAVAPIPGSDTSLGSYTFALVGRVDCREIGSERCQDFKDAVAAEPGLSLELDPPFTGADNDSDETDGGGTDSDGGAGNELDVGTEGGSDTGSDTGSGTGSGE